MIITDEALLRLPCSDVLPEEVYSIREALESELAHSAKLGREGIGLAAPQIGIYKNMAIVRIPTNNGKILSWDLVNAEVAHGYDSAFFEKEGCLSFPDKYERTFRFQEIHVVKNLVEPYSFIVTGLPAVCIQHELDHTKGILLPDLKQKR
jgi:peptide deformylase